MVKGIFCSLSMAAFSVILAFALLPTLVSVNSACSRSVFALIDLRALEGADRRLAWLPYPRAVVECTVECIVEKVTIGQGFSYVGRSSASLNSIYIVHCKETLIVKMCETEF